jgi:hypothetical protein
MPFACCRHPRLRRRRPIPQGRVWTNNVVVHASGARPAPGVLSSSRRFHHSGTHASVCYGTIRRNRSQAPFSYGEPHKALAASRSALAQAQGQSLLQTVRITSHRLPKSWPASQSQGYVTFITAKSRSRDQCLNRSLWGEIREEIATRTPKGMPGREFLSPFQAGDAPFTIFATFRSASRSHEVPPGETVASVRRTMIAESNWKRRSFFLSLGSRGWR